MGVNSGTEFPEEFDTADDGLGVIERGPTGDFQLRTGASSSLIGAGDTIIQTVTHADSSTEEFAGMLNFVFNTTPALKSVTIDSTTTTVDYTRTDTREGGNLNCFSAASSGDVIITVTGWRPQRPGIASAGEGNFVDIGNSAFVFDIPNAPCTISGGGGCSGNGPGNCGASSYSTSDANLTIGSNGLQDSRGDIDADVTNTYTFTVNLGTCLGSQAADWGAGETLFIDLQARSQDGDNAAQKFCVTRAP